MDAKKPSLRGGMFFSFLPMVLTCAHMETHKADLWTRSHRRQCCKIEACVAPSTGGTTSTPNTVACKKMHHR